MHAAAPAAFIWFAVVAAAPLAVAAAQGERDESNNQPRILEELSLDLEIVIDEATGQIEGSIDQPLRLEGMGLDFVLEGPDPADLKLLPFSLPHLPPYHVEGRLERDDNVWSIQNLSGAAGASDISGDLKLNTGGERPMLQANLASQRVDLVQILGKPEPGGPLISDTPIDLSFLRAIDALALYQAERVLNSIVTLDRMTTEISLQQGRLSLDPLDFGVLGGMIGGNLDVIAGTAETGATLDVKIRQVDLRKVLTQLGLDARAFGIVDGEIELSGSGLALADILASADGNIQLIMEGGELGALLVETIGLELGEILLGLTDSGKETVEIRCLIADFKVEEGIATSQTLIIDTTDIKIVGRGAIELGARWFVDITLLPRAKDFSLLSGQAPLHVRGTIRDLSIELEEARAVASLLTPIELGVEDDADCRELTQALRQQ